MRIISPFHDYYDSAMAFGQDQTVVFTRNTKEVEVTDSLGQRFNSSMTFHYRGNKVHLMKMHPVFICVSGKTYRAFQVKIWNKVPTAPVPHSQDPVEMPIENRHFYEVPDLKEFLALYKFQIDMNDYAWMREQEPTVAEFLAKQGTDENSAWLIENKISVFMYVNKKAWHASRHANPQGNVAYENPSLKDVEFYKVLDSFTAYQELDMFISGTLPQSTAMPIQIADKDKIPQHGFDKWSFRKPPEGK